MAARIRIGFITQYLSIGGIETRLLKLLRRIDRTRFDPIVICAQDDGLQAPEFKALGIPIITTRGLLPVNRALQYAHVFRLITRLGFQRLDVVMSFLPTSQPFENLLALIGVRRGGFAFGLVTNFRMGRDLDWESRARLASRIVSVSVGAARGIFGESAWNDKVRVIPNGVDVDFFDKARYAGPKGLIAVPAKGLEIGCIGRLVPVKRYDVLLDALVLLRDRGGDFRCVVAGQDRMNGWFQEQVSKFRLDDRVTYLGPFKDVAKLLADCDTLVLTSDNEGCPNSVLEAMATGIPVVVTRSGSEEFVIDGETGFVVPLGDAQAVADRLERLAADPGLRSRMGSNARDWIIRNASLDKMLNSYFELFEEMAGARRSDGRGN